MGKRTPEETAALRAALDASMRPVGREIVPDETPPEGTPQWEGLKAIEAKRAHDREILFGDASPETEVRATKLGEAESERMEAQKRATPATFGGQRAPSVVGRLAATGQDWARRAADRTDPTTTLGPAMRTAYAVGGALLPQSMDTPLQAADREARAAETAARAEQAKAELTSRLANIFQGSLPASDFLALVESATTPEAVPAAEARADFETRRSATQARLIEEFPELGPAIDRHTEALRDAEENKALADSATAVESPASYVLRLLGVAPSAAVGLAEGALGPRTVDQTMAERIRGGEGFTGGGVDLGRLAGQTVGAPIERYTGLPAVDYLGTAGAIGGGMVGFGLDLATPIDLGIGDIATGGKLTARAAARLTPDDLAVPVELRRSTAERALGLNTPATPIERSSAEMRNRIGGISDAHAVEVRTVANETKAAPRDADSWVMARKLGDSAADEGGQGEAVVSSIVRAIGGETGLVDKAGALEGAATRAEALAAKPVHTARVGTAARAAAADVATLERLRAEDGQLLDALRAGGQTEAAALIEARLADQSQIATATLTAEQKLARNVKYIADHANDGPMRAEAAVAARAAARNARSKADTYLHYTRVAERILADGAAGKSAEGLGAEARISKLVEDVHALSKWDTVPKGKAGVAEARVAVLVDELQALTAKGGRADATRISAVVDELQGLTGSTTVRIAKASGKNKSDARRALGGAYMQAHTWDIVQDVVRRSADPQMAAVRVELELGPEKFLEALRNAPSSVAARDAGQQSIDQVIVSASALGDTKSTHEALNNRAMVAAKLLRYQETAAKSGKLTQKAWAQLQATVGYGTPLINDSQGADLWAAAWGGIKWTYGTQQSAMKSGMLSGFLVPNPRFFINNMLTAPAIIYSTLGAKRAAGAVMSWDGVRVLRAMDGTVQGRNLAGKKIRPQEQIIVRTPTGQTYTGGQLARIAMENGIGRSQASVELGSQGVEKLMEFADVASAGRFRNHVKSLAGYGENFWAKLANDSDTLFRVNVLTDVLREGRPLDEAVTLARESLFDYGNLSRFERDGLGKVMWFWSFRRNNYRTLMRNILANPARLKSLSVYNNTVSEAGPNGEDTSFLATQGYAENTPMWAMVTDPEAGQRFALGGPEVPMVQAVEDLIHGMSLLMLTTEDLQDEGAGSAAYRMAPAVFGNMRPDWAGALSIAFGVDVQRAGGGLSGTLDPRFIWYLHESGQFESAAAMFDFQPVPVGNEVKAGGNFVAGPPPPGVDPSEWSGQWKIGERGKRQWLAAMFALSATGVQRAPREYAPAVGLVADTVRAAQGKAPSVQSPSMGNAPSLMPSAADEAGDRVRKSLQRIGVISGLAMPVNMPEFDQTPLRNATIREAEVAP